jgi:uncharacterized repeat protein (TIGR03803 family)
MHLRTGKPQTGQGRRSSTVVQWLAGAIFAMGIASAQQETVLYSFMGTPDGATPQSGVIRDSSGNLYGTTQQGGAFGFGTVYMVTAGGGETVLYSFTGGADGSQPYGGLLRSSRAGNLYGTTFLGGAYGGGVVFMVSPGGGEKVLYNFTGGADGGQPWAGVIADRSGNLYGTTMTGGAGGSGVVYKLDPAGNETVLYNFTGGDDGGNPTAGVTLAAGNFYGTTQFGGKDVNCGVVYEVNAEGEETVLHNFRGGSADGCSPQAGVVIDSEGNLYGTTPTGGPSNGGVVYMLTKGKETVLYAFTGGDDGTGYAPYGGVVRDSSGNLYGTAKFAGAYGGGIVFMLPAGGGETVLYNFTCAAGCNTETGLVLDSSGNVYGTAPYGENGYGVVFMVTP